MTDKKTIKRQQSRNWMLRFDAPEALSEEAFLSAFGDKVRVVGHVMLSTKESEEHPAGYRHIHAFLQSLTNSPIANTTIWEQVSKLLTKVDPKAYPPGLQPSIYCRKPERGITAAIDYVLKDEKRDEKVGLLESAVCARWMNVKHAEDFKGYGEDKGVNIEDLRAAVFEQHASMADLLHDPELAGVVAGHLSYVRSIVRQRDADLWREEKRDVRVLYIYGPAGTGKTHEAREWLRGQGFGGLSVFSVDDTQRDPFGGYACEPAVLFDDFRLSEVTRVFSFSSILHLLDKWPFQLSARYENSWAAFSVVAITANASPDEQLAGLDIRITTEDRNAFKRRLTYVLRVDERGILHDETEQCHSDVSDRPWIIEGSVGQMIEHRSESAAHESEPDDSMLAESRQVTLEELRDTFDVTKDERISAADWPAYAASIGGAR